MEKLLTEEMDKNINKVRIFLVTSFKSIRKECSIKEHRNLVGVGIFGLKYFITGKTDRGQEVGVGYHLNLSRLD